MQELVTKVSAEPSSRRHSEKSPTFKHVILTRFNIRYVEDPDVPSIGTDPDWLADRFALFDRHCLPSVRAQREQNFSWILFFDRATPEPFAERARELGAGQSNILPVFVDDLPIEFVKNAVRDLVPGSAKWVLTTRLDNDDALHEDFVRSVQSAQRFERAEVLNCPQGYVLSGSRAYKLRHSSNAFISLSEPLAIFQTVFSIQRHVYARESYPVRQLDESPLWMQVVHGKNISNRVRGKRVALNEAMRGFPITTGEVEGSANEDKLSILAENMSLYPLRTVRDSLVSLLRRTAKLFGVDLRRRAAVPPSG